MAEKRGAPTSLLLITVSTAGGPASLRVAVWRKLRSLGAVYLHQSVCLLPAREPVARQVSRLLARVRAQGGTGRVLTMTLTDADQYAELVAEFNAARDVEYGEVVERAPAFLAEIATETARGRASYAEVEESEADLARFRSWLAKIEARDWFGAPGGARARAAVGDCARALAEFEELALRREAEPAGTGTQPPADGRRLRAVPADGQKPGRRAVPADGQKPGRRAVPADGQKPGRRSRSR